MNQNTNSQLQTLPSNRKLVVTLAAAVLVAAVILVTFVLPAEYGIDPLGTGEALGLTVMSAPVPQASAPPTGATALKPVKEGPIAQYAGEYKFDSIQFTLGPYEYVEYKYHLEEGANMLYSWKASAAVVHDFHGERDSDATQVQSFDKNDRREAHGQLTAPFTGIHGWYWKNPAAETVTVMLRSAGFYSSAMEFRFDRTRRSHQVKSLENLSEGANP